MTMQSTPVVTGAVYVHGVLEAEFATRKTPSNPKSGDLRLHAHLDENGKRKRARAYCKAGYSGFIRASIFDGERWRKFMLALYVDASTRQYQQFAERSIRVRKAIRVLEGLAGRRLAYRDGAFACEEPEIVSAAQPPVEVLDGTPVFQLESPPSRMDRINNRKPSSHKTLRRRRRRLINGQLELFG